MLRSRIISVIVLGLLLCGSVGYTVSQAWYYRSNAYRQSCADYLSQALQLPADIARVIPRTRNAQEFTDVSVWLPERRAKIFNTPRALVTLQSELPERYDVQLFGGMAEISTRTWLRSDYRGVLESGLRIGLADNAVHVVSFRNMNVRLDTGEYALDLGQAGGTVTFEDDQTGHAAIRCEELNGEPVDNPVVFDARFSMPSDGVQIDHLEITVPRLPIALLRLEQLLGVVPTQGSFAGKLGVREFDRHRELTLTGNALDLNLEDLTRGLLPQPLKGGCPELEVTELRVLDGQPERLVVCGLVNGVELAEPFALAKLHEIAGQVSLTLRRAELSPQGLDLLVATGTGEELDLGDLTRSWGWGTVSGKTHIAIEDLLIRDNRIEVLVARCSVSANDPSEQWIDRSVVRAVVSTVLGMELPEWVPLPSRVPYDQFDFRLEIRDEQLYLLGGHGPGDRTILTVRILGRPVSIIKQPDTAFDLTPMLDQLRSEMERQIAARRPVPVARPFE